MLQFDTLITKLVNNLISDLNFTTQLSRYLFLDSRCNCVIPIHKNKKNQVSVFENVSILLNETIA